MPYDWTQQKLSSCFARPAPTAAAAAAAAEYNARSPLYPENQIQGLSKNRIYDDRGSQRNAKLHFYKHVGTTTLYKTYQQFYRQ